MSDGFLEFLRQSTGIWWPAADEDRLWEAALAHRRMADAIDAAAGLPAVAARSLVANNRGPAVDAFGTYWARYQAGQDTGWLADAARSHRQLAAGLQEYAAAVAEAKSRVLLELEILAAALIAGTALAVLTAGASQAAAAAVSAAALAAAQAVGVTLSALVTDVIAMVLVGAVVGTLESVTVNAVVVQPAHLVFGDQQGFDWDQLGEWASGGAVGGGLAGGLAGGLRLAASTAASADRTVLATRLDTLSTSLTGQALAGGLGNTVTAAVTEGVVTPADLVTGAIGGAAGTAAGRGLSRPGWRGSVPPSLTPDQQGLLLSARTVVGDIVRLDPGEHRNEVWLLTFGDGRRGVYKPLSGEPPFAIDPGPHLGVSERAFPTGGSAGRETARYRVDELYGFGLVPPTVVWDGPLGPGSLQLYVEGALPSRPYDDYLRSDQEQVAVLDYTGAPADSYEDNFLTHPVTGRPVAIDGQYVFPETTESELASKFVRFQRYEPLSEETLAAVRAVSLRDLRMVLEYCGIGENGVRLAVDRHLEMDVQGRITGEAWGGRMSMEWLGNSL